MFTTFANHLYLADELDVTQVSDLKRRNLQSTINDRFISVLSCPEFFCVHLMEHGLKGCYAICLKLIDRDAEWNELPRIASLRRFPNMHTYCFSQVPRSTKIADSRDD